jgi:hypothetical protein
MELIRCPRCAREIPEASRFCRRCGCAIAWRIGPPNVDVAPPAPPRRPPTVEKPLAKRVPVRVCKTSSGGGSGIFTLLAVAVFIFFARYHATTRPMTPRTPAAPMLPQQPAFPRTTPSLQFAPMTLSPTPQAPPASYPKPLRSNSAESSRTRTGANVWVGPSEPPPPYQWDDDPRIRYDYAGRSRSRAHSSERP